jgi:hypothetical protein
MAKISDELVPSKIINMCAGHTGWWFGDLGGLKCICHLSVGFDEELFCGIYFCFRHPKTVRRFIKRLIEWVLETVITRILKRWYTPGIDYGGWMSLKKSKKWKFKALVLLTGKVKRCFFKDGLTDTDFDGMWNSFAKGGGILSGEEIVSKYGMIETDSRNAMDFC